MYRRLFALLVVLFWITPTLAQPKIPDNVEVIRDVEFGKGGGRALKMHIVQPKKAPASAMPVVVWIHGGGWRAGSHDGGVRLLTPFAQRGYFCATAEYRLSGESKFPAQIEDCKCAIRYLRANAKKYNLDPTRIGVWGASAGGHLVALLGTTNGNKKLEGTGGNPEHSSEVQAVCDFFGPAEFVKLVGNSRGTNSPVTQLFGGSVQEKKELAKLAAPLEHVSKDAPPFLIVHGDKDPLVPLNQSQMLHEALKSAGADSTLDVVEGAGHGFRDQAVYKRVGAFFDKHLLKKKGE